MMINIGYNGSHRIEIISRASTGACAHQVGSWEEVGMGQITDGGGSSAVELW